MDSLLILLLFENNSQKFLIGDLFHKSQFFKLIIFSNLSEKNVILFILSSFKNKNILNFLSKKNLEMIHHNVYTKISN